MPGVITDPSCVQSVHLLKGTQKIIPNKRPQGERDFVTMLMCLVRLESAFDTDLLITFNVPDKHTDEIADACALGESKAFKDFLNISEIEFKNILASFNVSHEKLKDLIGLD